MYPLTLQGLKDGIKKLRGQPKQIITIFHIDIKGTILSFLYVADMNQDGSIDIIFINYESKNTSSSGRSVCHTMVGNTTV